jgi:ElaB/YqjD/DUF883 family membrane-anchored ribosome-binding protein
MFQPRSRDFDSRISAIVDHLYAVQNELGAIARQSGRASAKNAAEAGNQIADAISPILQEIGGRLRRGQRIAGNQAAGLANRAAGLGSSIGNEAASQLARRTAQRPFLVLAVAVGVGILIGAAGGRRL